MKKIIIIVLLFGVIAVLRPLTNSYADGDCVRRPIKQVAVNQQTQGSLYYVLGIGAGQTSQDFYYYIFIKTSKGGYRMIKENMEDVTIIEGAKQPYMWSCEGWQDHGWEYSGEYPDANKDFDEDLHKGNSNRMDVYVPSGSIVPTFTINMNK